MAWRELAACRGLNPNWWFAGHTDVGALTIPQLEDEAHAIAICKQCPVREDCLEDAVVNKLAFGVYGGLTAKQRERLAAWPKKRNYGFRAK